MAPKKQAGAAAAKFPAQGKLLANLTQVTAADRARAGITDEMANAMVSSNQPAPTGIQVIRGPWQASADVDVEDQVRVVDHDRNLVLFSGTEAEFTAYKRALARAEG
jgi:hypothetical protein